MSKLTGRQRHRLGLFGRLVLQVEEETVFSCGDPQCCDTNPVAVKVWRDATVKDLSVFPREGAVYARSET